ALPISLEQIDPYPGKRRVAEGMEAADMRAGAVRNIHRHTQPHDLGAVTAGDVPDADVVIPRFRQGKTAIGAELNLGYQIVMGSQAANSRAFFDIPQHKLVAVAGNRQRAIRVEGQPVNTPGGIALKLAHDFPAAD